MKRTPKLGTLSKTEYAADTELQKSTPSRIRTTPKFKPPVMNGKADKTPNGANNTNTPLKTSQKPNMPKTSLVSPSPKPSTDLVENGNLKLPSLTSPAKKRKASVDRPITRVGAIRRSGIMNRPMSSLLSPNVGVTPSPSKFSRRSYQGLGLTPTMGTSDLLKQRRSDTSSLESPCLDHHFADTEIEDETSSISVGVRVRPLNSREQSNPNVFNTVYMDGNEVILKTGSEIDSCHSFSYDHCFYSSGSDCPVYASQEDVYQTIAAPLLDQAFEGYNVCLFAYGQTGSGKTFCIMGDLKGDELSENAGVIPRFCSDLFKKVEAIQQQEPPNSNFVESKVTVEMSYVEIYNEKLYDLLGGHDQREALKVREHPEHGPYVVGAASHVVQSFNDLKYWLLVGNRERSIAATGMNDKSSRSHSVFSLKLTQNQVENYEGEMMVHNKVSIINLVDLAGSERVAATNSQGVRLKEGVCINKSLLTLGKVVTALAESTDRKKLFVPYRESLLTWLLKESLGGNSRTCMIATISPSSEHTEETLSTLRYACQARKIINRNHINEDKAAKFVRLIREREDRLKEAERNMIENQERSRMSGISLKVERHEPALVNLCQDPQLSQNLFFKLKLGETTLGQVNADIVLRNLPHESVHCTIVRDEDDVFSLVPKEGNDTHVNGNVVSTHTKLTHNDRIVLAGIYHFRLSCPPKDISEEDLDDDMKFDYYFARDELVKAQEERLRLEHAESEAKLLRELQSYKVQFLEETKELRENNCALMNQLENEKKLATDAELAKLTLQVENEHLSEMVKKNKFGLIDLNSSFSPLSPTTSTEFFSKIETAFDESVRIVQGQKIGQKGDFDLELHFMIEEANNICNKIKKPYVIRKQCMLERDSIEVIILIQDTQHNLTAKMNVEQFTDLVCLLRDMANNEHSDDTNLEMFLSWEREEEVTCLPFLVNKVKDESKRLSLNSSLNCSFNFNQLNNPSSSFNLSRKINARRRSSLFNSQTINESSKSNLASMASALNEYISSQKQHNHHIPETTVAFLSFVETRKLIKETKDILKKSNPIKSEDEKVSKLLNLTLSVQSCITNISNVTKLLLDNKYTSAQFVQESFINDMTCMSTSMKRILQGIEKEFTDLVQEELAELSSRVEILVTKMSTFITCAALPSPDYEIFQNVPNLPNCYIKGIGTGFINQIEDCLHSSQEVAKETQINTNYTDMSNYKSELIIAMNSCSSKISAFFEKMSQLTVALPESPTNESLPSNEVTDWINQMESSTSNLNEINKSLCEILQQYKHLLKDKIDITKLMDSNNELHRSLTEVIEDSGIGLSHRRIMDSSLESSSSVVSRNGSFCMTLDSIDIGKELFLETLHSLASRAVRSIRSLQAATNDYEDGEEVFHILKAPSYVKCRRRPVNANPLSGSPTEFEFKSRSLKTTIKSTDVVQNKKVRFNVNLDSISHSFDEEDSFTDKDLVDV